MAPTRDKWVRRFVITETSRHKRGFTVYKITSLVFLKSSPDLASKVSVWKRYNDLKKLHKSLSSLHQRSNVKESFPPFPKGKFFSRFELDVIKDRRDCAVKLLEFVSRHQSLASSETFVKFFETSLQPETDCSESIGSDTSEESQVSPAANGPVLIPQRIPKELNLPSKLGQRVENLPETGSPSELTSKLSHRVENLLETGSPAALSHSETLDQLRDPQDILDACPQADSNPPEFEQYVLIAAAHMSAGYRHESMNEHEEAFMQYKLGITNLLHGVQIDPDPLRRRMIHEKIRVFTDRAETLYDRYLNSNIALLSRSSDELKNYKVLKILKSVMLVRDTRTNVERIIKTVEKVAGEADDVSRYILRGNAPFVVKLQGFVQTETTVFLILNYVRTGRLWEAIKKRYGVEQKEAVKRGHVRSASDDAVLRISSGNRSEFSERLSEKLRAGVSAGQIADDQDVRTELVDESEVGDPVQSEQLPTMELLEKAQELLKSVDATIKKSNSIAGKLDERGIVFPPEETFDRSTDAELSVSDCSSGSFEKIDLAEVSNYFTDYHYDVRKIAHDSGVDGSEDSGVEMEQELWKIPENVVKVWAAQIVVTLEFLHRQNVIMRNLRPQNLLVDENCDVVFCYVVPVRSERFRVDDRGSYTAPELRSYSPEAEALAAADVWSFGVILYEMLTGMEFQTRHPGQYYSHSILSIPSDLSHDAKSLLKGVLIFEPSDRLTIKEIKHHSFFRKTEWATIGATAKSAGKLEASQKFPV